MKRLLCILTALGALAAAWFVVADDTWRFRGAEVTSGRQWDVNSTPTWENDRDFTNDVFTFTRLQYTAQHELYGRGHVDADLRWLIDFPACDLDICYRLQQMTSIKVAPDTRTVKMTDKELFTHPFLYLLEPGRGFLTDAEIPLLRKYLLNGGFLMVDDFWGAREWRNFQDDIERLFPPDRYPKQKIVDLPLEHPVFHTVFDLKEIPQVPGIEWLRYYLSQGTTFEFRRGDSDYETPHYRGISDDKGRLMVLICHNTDLGDGWEREGENQDYFRIFSEPKAFPMGINAIVYALTH
jgi:hypothetical protein